MSLKKIDQLLTKYNEKLKIISIDDPEYKTLLTYTVTSFFKEIQKIDKNFLNRYFNNINKENLAKNKVQEEAFKYLFLLTIKSMKISEIFRGFFPNYLEKSPVFKSNWRVIRWLKIFIAWLFKPKPKLDLNSSTDLLHALREMQDRIKNKSIYDEAIYLEIEGYKAILSIVKEFFENRVSSVIYRPLNWDEFLEGSVEVYENNVSSVNESHLSKKYTEINNLILSYHNRIKLLSNSVGSLSDNKNILIKKGALNLEEGILRRLKPMEPNTEDRFKSLKLTSEFKHSLSLNLAMIRFCYEKVKLNLDRQYEYCYGDISDTYKILDELEKILYVNESLFLHSINQAFSIKDYENLSITLSDLEMLIKKLENTAKKLDPKCLENEILNLIQYISPRISIIKGGLEKHSDFLVESGFSLVSFLLDQASDLGSDDASEVTSSDLSEREDDDGRSENACLDLRNQSFNADFTEREGGDGESENNSEIYSEPTHTFFSFFSEDNNVNSKHRSESLYSPKILAPQRGL